MPQVAYTKHPLAFHARLCPAAHLLDEEVGGHGHQRLRDTAQTRERGTDEPSESTSSFEGALATILKFENPVSHWGQTHLVKMLHSAVLSFEMRFGTSTRATWGHRREATNKSKLSTPFGAPMYFHVVNLE